MKKSKFIILIVAVVIITTLITSFISVKFLYPVLKEDISGEEVEVLNDEYGSNDENTEMDEDIALEDTDTVTISKDDYEYLKSLYTKYEEVEALEEYIRENYYKDVSEVDFMSSILKGMFEALEDPYSQYFTSEEYKSYTQETDGEYEGIGVVVSPGEDGFITVVSPIHDSPGFEAGIKINDKILKVDGVEYFADELSEAVMNIRGPAESTVVLTIRREEEIIDIPVVRRRIKLEAVASKVVEDHIGYLQIFTFDMDVSDEFETHLNELKEAGIDSLVIDLRYNGGGYLNQCLAITDSLIGEGIIVKTKDNAGNIYIEKSDEKELGLPLVILVNGGSASASEILTGAVKDNEEGIIVGTTTFGKGLVQTMLPLPMYENSGFKLTIEQYFTPDDHYIHGTGIEPNIIIENDEDTEEDEQYEKALEIIKELLK